MLSLCLRIRLLLQPVIFFCVYFSIISSALTSSEVLTIYCRDSFANTWGQQLTEQFKPYVNIIKLSGQALLTRLRLEGSHSPAEIVLGVDTTQVAEIAELGLAASFDYNTSNNRLPTTWAHTPLIPLAFDYLIILTHGNNDPIDTLDDLLRFHKTIIIPDPRTSTTGLEFLYWVQQTYGNQTNQFWQNFTNAVVTYPKGLSSSFALFMSSPQLITIGYSLTTLYGGIKNMAGTIKSCRIAGAPLQVYGVVVTPRGAEHALTTKVTDYLRSATFQNKILAQDCLYPAVSDRELVNQFDTALSIDLSPPPLLTVNEKTMLIADWLKACQP